MGQRMPQVAGWKGPGDKVAVWHGDWTVEALQLGQVHFAAALVESGPLAQGWPQSAARGAALRMCVEDSLLGGARERDLGAGSNVG